MKRNCKCLVFIFLSIVFVFSEQGCKKDSGQPLPVITSINPNSAIPGTPVEIKGINLRNVSEVRFGFLEAVFSIPTDTSISTIVPDSMPPGTVFVQVYFPDGVTYAGRSFTVIEAPEIPFISSINPSSAFPGDTISITGFNFTDVNSVMFGSISSLFTVDKSTKLSVVVPLNITSENQVITVASPPGFDTAYFNVILDPVITSFTPTQAHQGDLITISGKRFSGTTSVTLGSMSTSFSVPDDSTITFTVPAGASSGKITVTTPKGSDTSSKSLTVL